MSTAADPGPRVLLEDLTFFDRDVLRGGSASISSVTLDGQKWLYKKYSQTTMDGLDPTQLELLIHWRRALDSSARDFLDHRAAWPRSVVCEGAGVSGILLPSAPSRFMETSRKAKPHPRHLSRLTRPQEEGKLYYQMPEKLARLGHLGETMRFLHEHDVVVGDLQPKNVLTTAAGSPPEVMLIDCDSAVLAGRPGVEQLDPGHYKLPEPRDFDRASDHFKFALLVARCLEEDNTRLDCRDERALLVLTSSDLELLRRALRDDMDPADAVAWDLLLRTWRRSVNRSGALFYRNDEFVRQEWSNDLILPQQAHDDGVAVDDAGVQEVAHAGDSTVAKKRNSTRDNVFASVLIALTLLVVTLLVLWQTNIISP